VFRRVVRVAVMTFAAGAAAPAAFAQLATLESRDLRLVYISPSQDYLAPFVASSYRASQRFLTTLFDYRPDEALTVLLVDFSDNGNAGASTVPFNNVRVEIAPSGFAFETMVSSERMQALMNHELVHIIGMDQSTRQDRMFRRLFGGKVAPVDAQPESVLYFYLTSPRVAVPRWFVEGAAVFVETWANGGLGRAQGGYDEMVWRSMVRDGARFYDPLGLAAEGSKNTFQVEANSYLYGTRFMTWLAYRYSPDQLVAWIGRRPGSRAYYAAQFRHVFGVPLEQAWKDWIAWEREFQATNLAAVRKYPVTPYRDLLDHGLGSVSRAWLDPSSETLYAGFNAPGVVAHIGAIGLKNGVRRHLVDIKGPSLYDVSSVASDHAGTIFYTTDNNAHRDLVALDTRTGRVKTLQKDLRAGDLVLNRADKSLWGVRSLNGLHTVVRMEPPYTTWQQVVTFPFGTTLYDLDIAPDGSRLAASVGALDGGQSVRVFDLATLRAGNTTPLAQFDVGGGVPNNFVFSPDGRFLYGTSYFTGVSNVFRYDLAAGRLEAVTNTDTGFFRPIPLGGDELIVFRYTGEGFVPARITARPLEDVAPITFLGERTIDRHPVLKTWVVGPEPTSTTAPPAPDAAGVYRLGGGLRRESIYPIVQGYKDTQAVGARLNLSDWLQLNRASVTVSYSPWGEIASAERLHVRADYERYDWKASASWNNAHFYDLFGPTKVGRKGYDVTVGHTTTLLYDQPKLLTLVVEGTAAGHLDRLPEFQNVPVNVDRLYSARAELAYSDVRSSLGHVDDEKGHLWSATAQADHANAMTFLRLRGKYDVGTALPVRHASVWLRTAAGFSPQPAAEPFANFFFGGFGNNRVDHGEIKRYREHYAFPGAALNEIAGRNFVRSLAELALPPIRFSRVGTPGFYLSFLRPAVFAGGLVTNMDDRSRRRTAATAGAQIDLRATMLSSLNLTLSFGAGIRLERDRPARREAMISLALLK
jgi:hypothetical protein